MGSKTMFSYLEGYEDSRKLATLGTVASRIAMITVFAGVVDRRIVVGRHAYSLQQKR